MGQNCSQLKPTLEDQMRRFGSRTPDQSLTLDKLRSLSKYYIKTHNVQDSDLYLTDMLVSMRQVHLAQHLRKLCSPAKQEFKKNLQSINLEQLDNMYHQVRINNKNQAQYRVYSDTGKIAVKSRLNHHSKTYEGGRVLIKQRVVAVIILVGCFEGTDSADPLKCIQPLKLPSLKSCLQIQLQRIVYLNESNNSNIPVFMIVSCKYKVALLKWLQTIEHNLKIFMRVYRTTIPNVSTDGGLLLEDEKNFSYQQGKGDFLRQISKMGILQELQSSHIEYVHICWPSNLLEKVCDPFALGYLDQNNLDVVSKLITSTSHEQPQSLFLLESDYEKVFVKASVPYELKIYKFINSMFMRVKYLRQLSKGLRKQTALKLRSKNIQASYYDPVRGQSVFSNHPNALCFYRNPSDLIVGEDYKFLIVPEQEECAGLNDKSSPEVRLSNYLKQSCSIEGTKQSDILQISPLLFYDANSKEGISEIQRQIGRMEGILGFPCQIG